MDGPMHERWVLLRLRLGPGGVWVSYEDAAGNRRTVGPQQAVRPQQKGRETRWVSLPFWVENWPQQLFTGMRGSRLWIPDDLEELLSQASPPNPVMRYGPHSGGPIPLAVFVAPPAEAAVLPWEEIAQDLLLNLGWQGDPDLVQTVRLARNKWAPRSPFRLPIKVLAVGERGEHALSILRTRDWLQRDALTQHYGLRLEQARSEQAAVALRVQAPDVVVADEEAIEAVLNAAARLALEERPRLILVLGTSFFTGPPGSLDPSRAYILGISLPAGTSLLHVPLAPPDLVAEFVRQIIYGLIHDCPLHEALKITQRIIARDFSEFDMARPLLRADPASNAGLRMAGALAELHAEAAALLQTSAPGDLAAFLDRMGADAGPELRALLPQAAMPMMRVEDLAQQARQVAVWFHRESMGLVPLAGAEASVVSASEAQREAQAILAPVLADPAVVEAIRKHQNRRVDIAMDEQDELGGYEPVTKQRVLRPGGRYRLRVHIGHPGQESLMVGQPPPLDPLLPDPEGAQGHRLEVSVFSNDFSLASPPTRPLTLPLLGGSPPVHFDITAPQRQGEATLWAGIYHRNHLLQSFVLEAQVGPVGPVGPVEFGGPPIAAAGGKPALQVRLDLARTERFTNLEDLGPRRLALGVGKSDGGTHTLMLKCDQTAQSLGLSEAVLGEQVEKFRRILKDASYDSKTGLPRFPTVSTGSANGRTPEFESVIRQLADLGRDLQRAIWERAGQALRKELNRVAGQSDETLQIIRHDPNFVFPWPILYDFKTPLKVKGGKLAPVCLGFAEGEKIPADGSFSPVKKCSHGPGDKAYCLYGFWGMRHRVEQLLGSADRLRDAASTIMATPPPGHVCVAIDKNDDHTRRLLGELRKALGTSLVEAGPTHEILNMLWQAEERPAVLIVLGHLETRAIDGEPEEPRIILPGSERRWLLASEITDRHQDDGGWEQPRTLVFLMACGSGATDIGTLNDFVTALSSAGAAAVVGTECPVFTSLVARFAGEVTLDLWKGATLGQATNAFSRRLAISGNPLAFVFNCIGNADLTIATQVAPRNSHHAGPIVEPV
jgi:hypothetical protein